MQLLKGKQTLAVGAPLLLSAALLLICLAHPSNAAISDAADSYENFVLAGRCHGMMGFVQLTSYLDEGVQNNDWPYDGKPTGKQQLPGPTLWHRKDLTNWADNNGDFCNGEDQIPYPLPANSRTSWTIGEKQAGWYYPELYLYFGVGDPITGKQTDCLLSLFQDLSGLTVTVTLKKTAECNGMPVMMNNLKIKQSGIFCSSMEDLGINGISENFQRVGNSQGDCGSSRRLGEDDLVKVVYTTSFSVYWDPPINGTPIAAGFGDLDTVTSPAAAPEAGHASSSVKSHRHNCIVVTVYMGIMAALVLTFFSA